MFDRVRQKLSRGQATSMADVSTLNLLRQMFEQSHNNRRMEAQVDAIYKCKHGDKYEPPEPEDDEMQILMNNVITDKKTLSKALGEEGGSGKPLAWLMGTLATGAIAAGLTAYLMGDSTDTNTQNTLRPANPSQIVERDA